MILFTAAYEAAEENADRPMLNPRIGWDSLTRDAVASDVTASSSTGTGPSDSPLRPDTAEFWQPSSMPATWLLEWADSQSIDYLGIAAHDLGSSDCTVEVETSNNEFIGSPLEEVWTPLARAHSPGAYIALPGTSDNYAITPDSAANSITGDIDIRARIGPVDWTPAAVDSVVSKHDSATERSYRMMLNTTGLLQMRWSADGTTEITKSSTANLSALLSLEVKWVRATLDVDNGAAGNDVNFYTSDNGVDWTQLGATVTTAGVTSIFNSTSSIEIGTTGVGGSPFTGNIFYAEIRNGINGSVVVRFDPSEASEGATSFVSSTGETWTINQSGADVAQLFIDADNDKPLLFLDTIRNAIKVRITLSGGTAPRIAVIYVGLSLWMQEPIRGMHAPIPLSRQTILEQQLSRGGQFLGQNIRRRGYTGSVKFDNLDADWYRTNFDPFVQSARRFPYFFAWRPGERTDEVVYAWTGDDIAPAYEGFMDFMSVSWNLQALGDE